MKKELPKDKKRLENEDFLRFHRTGKTDIDPTEYDVFSQAALRGVRYQKVDPKLVLSRMEKRLNLKTTENKVVSVRMFLTAAASVLILVSVGYLAFFQETALSGERLYQDHFEAISYVDDDISRGTRAQGARSGNTKERAVQAYSSEQYDEAEGLFQLYLSLAEEEDRIARFYYGITLLEQRKFNAAISIFTDTKNRPPIDGLERPATYYLALSYVRQEQHEKAYPLLKLLADKEDRYGRTARELLSAYGL